MPTDKKTRVRAQTFVRKGDGTVSISPMVSGALVAGTETLLFVCKSNQHELDESKTMSRETVEE